MAATSIARSLDLPLAGRVAFASKVAVSVKSPASIAARISCSDLGIHTVLDLLLYDVETLVLVPVGEIICPRWRASSCPYSGDKTLWPHRDGHNSIYLPWSYISCERSYSSRDLRIDLVSRR